MTFKQMVLSDIASVVGRGITPRYVDGDGLTVINQRCIRDGLVNLAQARRHDGELRGTRSDRMLAPGDTLVNSTGVGTLGRVANWTADVNATVDSHVTIVRANEGTDATWLGLALRLRQGAIESLAEGSTGQTELSPDSLRKLTLLVPPLPTQRAIADVLGALDDKIAANRRVVEKGRQLLQARWDEITVGSSSPVAWGDVIETNPKVPPVNSPSAPYLDMKNLPEHGLLVDEWGEREPKGGARFLNGDTLLARITPCFENGKMGLVDFLADSEIGYGSTEFIVFRGKEGLSPAVAYCAASSIEFRTFAARQMTGTSGRQRVQTAEISTFGLPWPTDQDLREFNELAEGLLLRLTAARNENQTLARTRDELLPLLMSGKITVKDAEATVEGVL